MAKHEFTRRKFLRQAGVAAVAAAAIGAVDAKAVSADLTKEDKADSSHGGLFDKFCGCIAGAYLGSSFGVPVEGWDRRKIAHRYGLIEEFLPFRTKGGGLPPGSTEDGIERQKYMYLAIIEKQDRITAQDLVATWLRVITPDKLEAMEHMTEQFDRDLMRLAQSGDVPAAQLGEHGYAHLSAPIRCFHPIVLINACDEQGAIRDTHEILRVYQPLKSNAFAWGAAYNAAAAHALRADATVESVIETALKYSTADMAKEIQTGLDIVSKYSDPIAQRKELYEDFALVYNKETCTGYYDMSRAHECATIALSMFKAAEGNVKDAMILATNNGRDTDCNTAAAAALAGALSGTETIPSGWIELVDSATKANPYTNSKLTIRQTADGMYKALQNKIARMQTYVELMKSQA